jgi:hypothetical protein
LLQTLCLSGFSLVKGDKKKNAFLYKEGGSALFQKSGEPEG